MSKTIPVPSVKRFAAIEQHLEDAVNHLYRIAVADEESGDHRSEAVNEVNAAIELLKDCK